MKQVSRRKSQKGAALTSILMGLPTLVPAQVVAGKGVKRVMPNDRINIGQIGCGSIANYYHSNALKRMEDDRVIAACDAYRSCREWPSISRSAAWTTDHEHHCLQDNPSVNGNC